MLVFEHSFSHSTALLDICVIVLDVRCACACSVCMFLPSESRCNVVLMVATRVVEVAAPPDSVVQLLLTITTMTLRVYRVACSVMRVISRNVTRSSTNPLPLPDCSLAQV